MTTETMPKPERPLRVDQVAQRLGCEPQTVTRLCRAGAFPGAVQFVAGGRWRVPLADVAAFIARRRAAAS